MYVRVRVRVCRCVCSLAGKKHGQNLARNEIDLFSQLYERGGEGQSKVRSVCVQCLSTVVDYVRRLHK